MKKQSLLIAAVAGMVFLLGGLNTANAETTPEDVVGSYDAADTSEFVSKVKEYIQAVTEDEICDQCKGLFSTIVEATGGDADILELAAEVAVGAVRDAMKEQVARCLGVGAISAAVADDDINSSAVAAAIAAGATTGAGRDMAGAVRDAVVEGVSQGGDDEATTSAEQSADDVVARFEASQPAPQAVGGLPERPAEQPSPR